MNSLEQIFLLPYAFLWLPALIFAVVVGGAYWFFRPAPVPEVEAEGSVKLMSATAKSEKSKEQRNMHRRMGNPIEVFVTTSEDKDDAKTGSVLDRSMGGMRLALFWEMQIGAVIAIRPVNADAIVPWVELEVRSCRPSKEMPGQHELGCQYVKSPPYSIQLLFG